MNETLPLLTQVELEVSRLLYVEELNETAISDRLGLPLEKVKHLVKSVQRKRDFLWRNYGFKEMVTEFQRTFRCMRVNAVEDRKGVEHTYNIDYSDLFTLLDPKQASKLDLENVGYSAYMFEAKLTDDMYCLLPPSAWECLRHLEVVATRTGNLAQKRFEDFMRHRRFKRFYGLIMKPPSDLAVYEKRLKSYYEDMGGLINVLTLAEETELDRHLDTNIQYLESLVESKTLLPIEDCVAQEDWGKNDQVYKKTLDYLSRIREYRSENNEVDALALAITYYLTDRHYYSRRRAYRLVSHSPRPLRAFIVKLPFYQRQTQSSLSLFVLILI